jgi:parvulin-like peptidyl-prolyl isomerase
LFDDPVRARGKGFEVRQSEVDDMVTGLRATIASTRNQTIPDEQREPLAAQMLDRLVLTRIIQQRATDADKARAAELSTKFIADTKSKARSEESYRRQLTASGIKPELFESRAFDQALLETVVDREVKSTVTVTDEQVRDFYEQGINVQARDLIEALARLEKDKSTNTVLMADLPKRLAEVKKSNLDRLDRPETVRAQALLVYTIDRITRNELPDEEKAARKEQAVKAIQRLQAGEDFAKVAREVSEDPDVAKHGGEYTTVRDAVAYPELRVALFSLPIGQLSDIIPTRVGYYVAKVLERTPAGKVPFDKAEKEIRDILGTQEVQKRLPAFFERLKKEYDVTYVGASASAGTNTPPVE